MARRLTNHFQLSKRGWTKKPKRHSEFGVEEMNRVIFYLKRFLKVERFVLVEPLMSGSWGISTTI